MVEDKQRLWFDITFLCLEDSHLLRLEPLAPPFFPLAAGA
jgi:hypothetical protein